MIDCLWNFLNLPATVDHFLSKDGVDLLLDMFEACPASIIKNQIIGFLTDLTRVNFKAIDAIHRWQSQKTYQKFIKHLVSLWEQEERRLGSIVKCSESTNL